MSSKNLDLAVNLALADKISKPLDSTVKKLQRLNVQTKKLDGLSKLNNQLGQSGQKLDASKKKLADLGRELSATENPSAKLRKQFEAAQKSTKKLTDRHRELREQAQKTRKALRNEGVDTRNLGKAQEQLQSQIKKTTAQLQRQQKIRRHTGSTKNNATSGFQQISTGAIGIVGASASLKALMQPINEMQSALGEVASLDVDNKTLKGLQNTAVEFSTEYGGSAANFVAASYDIQSSIGGLKGDDLANFTKASAILAKGTKSDVSTITGYMGTMYGIFQEDAERIGKSEWVDALAGKTASAVKMFKTTGDNMSAAFSNLGAEGQAAGVSMSEQLAILGQLQATMSGSEAGTKYKAFLNGVGKAQDQLGLKFTDSAGKMLPMTDILGKIKQKFGDIDTVEESDLLKKAFGTSEAVALVKLLGKDVDGLKNNISKIGEEGSLDSAIKMADKITSPWDKADAGFEALQITLGDILLPTILDGLTAFNSITKTVRGFATEFPAVAKLVSMGALAIVGLVAGISTLAVISGTFKMVQAGWNAVMAVSSTVQWAWNASMTAGGRAIVAQNIATTAMAVKQKALAAGSAILTAGQWAWNAAMTANPIGLVIAAVAALAAGAVLLYNNWDTVMAWFGGKMDWLKEKFSFITDLWDSAFGDKKTTVDVTKKVKTISDKLAAKPTNNINAINDKLALKPAKVIDFQQRRQAQAIQSTANNQNQSKSQQNINITINAAPGMDEKAIADQVTKQLQAHQRQQQSAAKARLYDRF